MNILYKHSGGMGRVSLPANKASVIEREAVWSMPDETHHNEPFVPVELSRAVYSEPDESQGDEPFIPILISPAVMSEPISGHTYGEFHSVEISPAIYRDETDSEQLQRMIDAGHLPDLPWDNWLELPDTHEAMTADVELISVSDWSDIASITTAPTPIVVPSVVSARQFKLALLASGLYEAVETWVAAQPIAVRIAYAASSTFVRDDKVLEKGFKAMGVAKDQIDTFFIAASKI